MTLLSAAFREQVKKTKDISMINEQQHSVAYSTGFLNIDFLNGTILNINGKNNLQVIHFNSFDLIKNCLINI